MSDIELLVFPCLVSNQIEGGQGKMVGKGLTIYCDCCGELLTEPGALVFSPPISGFVQKYHVCQTCYERLIEDIVTRQSGRKGTWKNEPITNKGGK